MAAPTFDTPLPGDSFFNIYTDGAARTPTDLPTGGCNFVDLTHGAGGARCGCRHFWTRFAAGRAYADTLGSDHTAFCMCSHHACYHDYGRNPEPTAPASSPAAPLFGYSQGRGQGPGYTPGPGQENEKPRGNREPLSPVILGATSPQLTPVLQGGPTGMDVDYRPDPAISALMATPNRVGDLVAQSCPKNASQQPESTLQDTLPWAEFIKTQSQSHNELPPIPQQCHMPGSQQSSTGASSHARYLAPFNGRGLATLSGAVPKTHSPPSEQDEETQPMSDHAQEIAPGDSVSAIIPHTSTSRSETPKAKTNQLQVTEPEMFGVIPRQTFQHMSDTVRGHEQRLERLETSSFSGAGHEECDQKHDNADLRLAHLEERVEEMEKNGNDAGSHVSGSRTVTTDVTCSIASQTTNSSSRDRLSSSQVLSQLHFLYSQMSQIRNWVPLQSHPWEIEVVFLPFPLRRVWQEPHDFKQGDTRRSSDEWTQLPNTNSTTSMRAASPFTRGWAEPGEDSRWLLPKACGPQSLINSRLRSRGLVRNITVKAPDARSVQAAMQQAFGDTLADMAEMDGSTVRRRGSDERAGQYLGLRQSWVPLQKIHKESRLRFLSPSEMLTPALWDVPFLHAVIMRAAVPRLYVTQPEAYLQDEESYHTGWTWQKVRELNRVYSDSQVTQGVPESDALESCWTWSDALDEPASAQSSLSTHQQARQRISASPSQQRMLLKDSRRSVSPYAARAYSPAIERRASRPPPIRTTSVPITAAPSSSSPSHMKRRVVSNGQNRVEKTSSSSRVSARSSPVPVAANLGHKRRRTHTPIRPLNTPRWTTSPSPVLAELPVDVPPGYHQRGMTPMHYATPASNSPYRDARSRSRDIANDYFSADDDDFFRDDGNDMGDDEDDEIGTNIWDDGEDEGDYDNFQMVDHQVLRNSRDGHPVQPQDEPWPGIEDQDHISEEENMDPHMPQVADDATSVASSRPSEYPSTHQGWELPDADEGAGFEIHEDEQMPDSQ